MNALAHRRGAPASVLGPVAACVAAAGAAAGVGLGAGITGPTLLEAPLSLLLLGVVLGFTGGLAAARARTQADEWIRRGYERRYAWRAEELVSRRERKRNARIVRGLLRELKPGAPLGPIPLDRRMLRANEPLLEQLAHRLADEEPVSAAGMVEVERLLTNPESALFPRNDSAIPTDADRAATQHREELSRSITDALDALEVRH